MIYEIKNLKESSIYEMLDTLQKAKKFAKEQAIEIGQILGYKRDEIEDWGYGYANKKPKPIHIETIKKMLIE